MSDREIVFDTETTGFEAEGDDRIVEIGCLELINHVPTGETYHVYINPERDMPTSAFEVHGLSEEFLSGHPVFAKVADGFLDFIGDAKLIAHNATFDMRFINAELGRMGRPALSMDRVIDTLLLARKKFPGAQNNLDALCRRFEVDNSNRELHGALLDSELLAEVYLELIGGRQPGLVLAEEKKVELSELERNTRPARSWTISEEERAAHEAFIKDKVTDALWLRS